jgi:hypothetical protein
VLPGRAMKSEPGLFLRHIIFHKAPAYVNLALS